MKRGTFPLAALMFVWAAGAAENPDWQSLFNGQDLSGWSVRCNPADAPRTFWRAEEGAILADSLSSTNHDYVWLVTDREFDDFVLRLKFQAFRSSPGNSGVQLRSRYDAAASYLDGPQVDIQPPEPWRTGMVWDETRGNQRWLYPAVAPGKWVDPSLAVAGLKFFYAEDGDAWNELEIAAVGTHLGARLNGVQVMNYDGTGVLDDAVHARRNVGVRGSIALQIHRSDRLKIRYKDIQIKTAPPSRASPAPSFRRLSLSKEFVAEGIAAGDVDRDGKTDVVAGPYCYLGPKFENRFAYRTARAFDPAGYSDHFLTFTHDLNRDGWTDILVIDTPGQAATWYENPQRPGAPWPAHLAFSVVDNESPDFTDLTGDGRPELVCNYNGFFGYAAPDWEHPTQLWQFRPISPKGSWHKYTHGLGVGDVNGDGRKDVIEVGGWWEQPASAAPVWTWHAAAWGEGGAQMFAYDFDGDRDADIATCLHPHKYGLAWFEQQRGGDFARHLIMGEKAEENAQGLRISQLHAQALADIDGDGIKDLVTGKRYWAHKPPTDPDSDAPAVLYWFQTVRGAGGKIDFVAHLIDSDSGVGMQVLAEDLNSDGRIDVAMCNKKGSCIFLQESPRD